MSPAREPSLPPQLEQRALHRRKRVADGAWITAVVVLCTALGIAWFFRTVELDLRRIGWLTLGQLTLYLAATAVLATKRARVLQAGMAALVTLELLYLGVVWQWAGGLQFPLVLFFLAVPIAVAGLLLPRAAAYGVAGLCSLMVVALSLRQSSELSWFWQQLGLPLGWLGELVPQAVLAEAHAFPATRWSPQWEFTMLVVFVAAAFTTAVLSGALSALLLALEEQLRTARRDAAQQRSAADSTIRSMPLPTLLLGAAGRRVLAASRSFERDFGSSGRGDEATPVPPRPAAATLFDLVPFVYPEAVEELLVQGGRRHALPYRRGDELRWAEMTTEQLESGETVVSLIDTTDGDLRSSAVEATSTPIVLVGADERVRWCNTAAQGVFPGLQEGAPAALLAAQSGGASQSLPQAEQRPWWRLGERARHRRRVHLNGQQWQVELATTRLRGEATLSTVLVLGRELPVAE